MADTAPAIRNMAFGAFGCPSAQCTKPEGKDDMDEPTSEVKLEVHTPATYERAQLVVRLLICCALGMIHSSLFGIMGGLYLLLPLGAAILLSQHTSKGYLEDDGPWVVSVLEWVINLYAYMLFVIDRFPLTHAERPLHLVTRPHGEPTLPNALSRLVTTLPHALLLLLLSIPSALATLIMAFAVLLSKSVPESLRSFQLRVIGLAARLLVYHASLTKLYPPFSMSSNLLPSSTPDHPAQDNA